MQQIALEDKKIMKNRHTNENNGKQLINNYRNAMNIEVAV